MIKAIAQNCTKTRGPGKKMIKTTMNYMTEDHFAPIEFEWGFGKRPQFAGQVCHFFISKFLKK